jgi:Cofilin/tropomyosin-type actin-binding protein
MATIKFTDRDACDAQVADVRSDTSNTNWALFSYAPSSFNVIEHVTTGTGGIEDMHAHLKEDMIGYALLRVVDLVDGHKTIKFVKVCA